MPDPPVPPSRWGDSPPWWLTAETLDDAALDDEPPPSDASGNEAPSEARAAASAEEEVPRPDSTASGARTSARRPRRKAMLLGAVGGLCAVVAAVVGGAFLLDGEDGGTGKRITLASQAGGLHRAAADPAASTAYPFIAEAVRRGGIAWTRQTSAVYSGDMRDILFVGGTAAISDPAAFLERAKPNTVLAFRHVGRGVCGTFAVLSAVHPYCAWATSDSYGFVASNVPARDAGDLAGLVPRMRADLER
ncbi:hypothetical protein AB0J52_07280 [Spirillospora sp. NPDC049652]